MQEIALTEALNKTALEHIKSLEHSPNGMSLYAWGIGGPVTAAFAVARGVKAKRLADFMGSEEYNRP